MLGCYLNLADPDGARLAETIEKYKAQIRFASWLGAGVVGTETGNPNSLYVPDPQAAQRKPYIRLRKIFPVLWNMRKKWEWW